MTREQKQWNGRGPRVGLEAPAHVQAVRVIEADVEEDAIRARVARAGLPSGSAGHLLDVKAVRFESESQRRPHASLIVDEKDRGHVGASLRGQG